MNFHMPATLPHAIFFKPNTKFLETISEMDNPLIEMGAGVGHTIKEMHDYGLIMGKYQMINCRGFDLHPRDSYEDMSVAVGFDATEFKYYNDKQTVLVCRPDHGGWVMDLLDSFEWGHFQCKRFVYVGLEENICRDFTDSQVAKVSRKITGVGEDEEVMLIWEFN